MAAKVSVASPEFYTYVFGKGNREDEDEGPECFPSMGQGHVQTFPKLMATSSTSSSQFHQGQGILTFTSLWLQVITTSHSWINGASLYN